MCYRVSTKGKPEKIESQFKAKFKDLVAFKPHFHITGFDEPFLPVISGDDSSEINHFQWKSNADFDTLNAKSETLYDKYFKRFADRRCLILVTGFFEHRDFNKKKYPYFIKPKNETCFAIGGIISDKNTLSIITTDANPLLAKIHNSKLRMPLILPADRYSNWLNTDLSSNEAKKLMVPFNEAEMEAYTISRIITQKGADTDCAEAIKPFQYPELTEPLTLF